MRGMILTMAAGLAFGAAVPLDAAAQGRVGDRLGGRAEEARARGVEQQRRGEADRRDERRGADARADARLGDRIGGRSDDRRQGGPPFCSNGRGHPVHGMQWCRDRGFASAVIWRRAPWEDVRLSNPQRASRSDVGRAVLIDILGQGAYGRVDAQRRALGVTDALTGRWIRQADGSAVLRVTAGGVPIAEFIDRQGNGRADFVRINAGG
jgi:hypothetical protein